jgi:mono/diheme cytochrome c family protein
VNPERWRPVAAAAVAVAAAVATPFAWRTGPTRVELVEEEQARPAAVGDARLGDRLFAAKGCVACHTGPTQGTGFVDISDARDWAGDRKAGYTAAEYLTESIRTPGAYISARGQGDEMTMPDLHLTDEEIADVVAYLLAE